MLAVAGLVFLGWLVLCFVSWPLLAVCDNCVRSSGRRFGPAVELATAEPAAPQAERRPVRAAGRAGRRSPRTRFAPGLA